VVAAGGTTVHGTVDVFVVRLDGTGALDPSYGAGTGASAPDFGGSEFASGVAIARDGKIVVGGTGTEPGSGAQRLLAARFLVGDSTQAGCLDLFYGAATGASRPAFPGRQTGAGVAVQPSDGKILVAGTTILGTGTGTSPGNFIVARFLNPDGILDVGFGASNGAATVDFGGNGSAGDGAVVRLQPNGSLDSTFGSNGKKVLALGRSLDVNAVAVPSDGKIVLAGSSHDPTNPSRSRLHVARLQGDPTDTGSGNPGGGNPGGGKPAGGGTRIPTCMGHKATVIGTSRNDKLTGTKRADVIVGLGGNDTIKPTTSSAPATATTPCLAETGTTGSPVATGRTA
jgi:uncharacterized delta-60 repeat protein